MKARQPKHERIFGSLRQAIAGGRWQPGERLPSEAELTRQFDVSRITVSRAMRDLQRAGLVERRPGSGTYVKSAVKRGSHAFGVLIPDLGAAEIFEPIFRGMMTSPLADRHALILGNSAGTQSAAAAESARVSNARHLCRQYIERRVSGVFFAPLEHLSAKDAINAEIGRAFRQAGIPVVLLDRPLLPFPAPPGHDLVGIDNRRAGYVITEHLLRRNCRRLHFLSLEGAASTVDDREAGFREALYAYGLPIDRAVIHRTPEDDIDGAASRIRAMHADGVVCTNDRLAGSLMHAFGRLGCCVPQDIRLVGIDDVEYANLLPVPLTTLRQPTGQIGETALAMMLERIARPGLPLRDVRLQCELVVRDSCGPAGQRPG